MMVQAGRIGKNADFPVPPELVTALRKFILDKCTGSVTCNIRDGEILGVTLNEQVKIEKPPKI